MRTTLDLDNTVLAAARAKAQAEGISLGKAVSMIALRGLSLTHPHETGDQPARPDRFPIFYAPEEHLITDELVTHYRDDD